MEATTDTTENVTPIANASNRRKQPDLPAPGMARQVEIPALEDAALAYVKVRDERMALTEAEKAAKEKLLALCIEHKVERYEVADENGEVRVVKVKTKSKVTVRKATSEGAEGDEDEEA